MCPKVFVLLFLLMFKTWILAIKTFVGRQQEEYIIINNAQEG